MAVRAQRTIVAGIALVLVLGTALTGHGAWMVAKAGLAQILLNHAWTLTRRTGEPHRPWFWADTHPVARLRVPAHGIDQVVLDGSSGRTLAFGPGRVPGTSIPGEGGPSAVSGHRDTHFRFLEYLRAGDVIHVERPGATHHYRVERALVIDVGTGGVLLDPAGDELLLITCYPFRQWTAGGSRRYVVIARPALSPAAVPDDEST